MKTIILLFCTMFLSFVHIRAQTYENKPFSNAAARKDKNDDFVSSNNVVSNRNTPLRITLGNSWKDPHVPERLLKQIDNIIKDLNKEKVNLQSKLNDLTHQLSELQKEKKVYAILEIDNRINELTKSQRNSVLALMVFFIAALLFILITQLAIKKEKNK